MALCPGAIIQDVVCCAHPLTGCSGEKKGVDVFGAGGNIIMWIINIIAR